MNLTKLLVFQKIKIGERLGVRLVDLVDVE
jgi:hypothetical protein